MKLAPYPVHSSSRSGWKKLPKRAVGQNGVDTSLMSREEIVDILIDSHRRMLTTPPRHDVSRGVCRVSPSA